MARALAVPVVPQGAIALRNKLVSAMVDLPDSRNSRQGLSQANVTNHAVAACDSPLAKRDVRNSRAFDCSSFYEYTDF